MLWNRYHEPTVWHICTDCLSCHINTTGNSTVGLLVQTDPAGSGHTHMRGNPMASTQVNDVSAVKLRAWRVLTMLASLVAVIVGLVAIFMSAA